MNHQIYDSEEYDGDIFIGFVKTHKDAKLPERAHPHPKTGDTGYDVTCVEDCLIPARGSAVVPVGLTLAYLTPGYWIEVCPKSGLGFKHGIYPHPGVIDNSYRGDLGIKMWNYTDTDYEFKAGDKVSQLVLRPLIVAETLWADKVQETARGAGGFGSTGR